VLSYIPKSIPVSIIYVDDVFNIPKFKIFFHIGIYSYIEINNNKVKVIWLRKSFKIKFLESQKDFQEIKNNSEKKFLKKEWTKIYENFSSIIKYCPEVKIIGGSKYSNFTDAIKLEILYLASSIGLDIPKTIFSNYLPTNTDTVFITKPIGEFAFLKYKNSDIFGLYTSKIRGKYLHFAPSLFQEFVQKKADIRVFFMDNQIFAGAIFESNKEKLDYRNYDIKNMPYWLRFKIPDEIKEKIKKLMSAIEANFGILDFLLTNEDNLMFLEINLGGQFGDLSYNCNYNLEKFISNKLISFYE